MMTEREYEKFSIDNFIKENLDKHPADIYLECCKEGKWAENYPTGGKSPQEMHEAYIVSNYAQFLSKAGNAFGGFNNAYDLSDVKGTFEKLRKGF